MDSCPHGLIPGGEGVQQGTEREGTTDCPAIFQALSSGFGPWACMRLAHQRFSGCGTLLDEASD